MLRRHSAFRDVARSLRRAVRAAHCVCGDPLAASLLVGALAFPCNRMGCQVRPVFDYLICVELAEENGLSLQEFGALGPQELIDLLWPDQTLAPYGL